MPLDEFELFPDADTETNSKQEGPGNKKIWAIIIAVVVCLIIFGSTALAYFYFAEGESSGAASEEPAISIKDIKKMTLDAFTVNLADNYRKYLRTTISIEYTSKDLEKELQAKLHRIRDLIIEVLRSKKSQDFNTPEGTAALKQELLQSINAELEKGKLTGLYFEEFVIQ